MVFFDELADVYAQTVSESGAEQVAALSLVAASQPCAWWSYSAKLADGQLGRETEVTTATVCFRGSSSVQVGSVVRHGGKDWLVESVAPHKWAGVVDNLECKAKLLT